MVVDVNKMDLGSGSTPHDFNFKCTGFRVKVVGI